MDKSEGVLITQTIDWLSYTISWHELDKDALTTLDGQRASMPHLVHVEGDWTRDVPLHGYEDAWVNKEGGNARVMISRPGHAMGVHVQLPGQALAKMHPLDILQTVEACKASVTRIDIAIDFHGVSDPEDCYQAFMLGAAETRAANVNLITGTKGKTCYVGSRSSERYLRVYDKAAQTQTEGDWTRIELECKGRVAKWVAKTVKEKGYNAIPPIIRKFFAAPKIDWYERATTVRDAEIGTPEPKKMTDTRGWLLGVVAKTLAKETKEDTEFLLTFLREVQKLRGMDEISED